MRKESYIVEGSNWKCKVSLEKGTYDNIDYKLVEAATRCFEHLFSNFAKFDSVDIFELKDEDGVDYFKQTETDVIPDPAFGLLTKIYSIKDIKNIDNHYFIKTRTLMENASISCAMDLVDELEVETKKKNPNLYKNISKLMKGKLVFRMGDLKDLSR